MKQRMINISKCQTCKTVLIAIERDLDGNDKLKIQAWHKTSDGDLFQEEVLENFEFPVLLDRILIDFSEASANDFANSFEL